jgi:hypothetical protein
MGLFLCGEDPSIDAPTAIAKTDAGGFYSFSELVPACLQVAVDASSLPAGLSITFDYDDGATPAADGVAAYSPFASEVFLGLDFGYVGADTSGSGSPDYCLADRIWYDADANGFYDGADTPIGGVTVSIRGDGGDVHAWVVSAADGTFEVCGLQLGVHGVEIADRFGALVGLMGTTQGGVDGSTTAVVADEDVSAESFGYIEQGWLADCVWTTDPDPADGILSFTPTSITDDIPFVDDGSGRLVPENNLLFDLGCQPKGAGSGTPGYWKNHPEAWPVSEISLGGVLYTREEAIWILDQSTSRDMTYVLAAQLIAAKLNVFSGNESSCVSGCIADADAWLVEYPTGSGVRGNSKAWKQVEPLKRKLDRYNNGLLCAPSRG